MPKFVDAVGYLLELRDAKGEPWFAAACDLALGGDGREPAAADLSVLLEVFLELKAYTPTTAAVAPTLASVAGAKSAPFLEQLGGFSGFKKLSNALAARFPTQLTLLFGKNGSGKTSLCQALKLLASADRPINPLQNVRAQFPAEPSFAYRFRGSPTVTTWTAANGFGAEEQSIKYFDASVAHRHVTGGLQPDAVVEVAAFRTEVFDCARTVVSALQKHASRVVSAEGRLLQDEIDAVKGRLSPFVAVDQQPLVGLSPTNAAEVVAALAAMTAFGPVEEAALAERQVTERQFLVASSEEGLRALKAQAALLQQLATQAETLVDLCAPIDLATLQNVEVEVARKKAARQELQGTVFPTGVDSAQHHALIVAAGRVVNLGNANPGTSACPLCLRSLDVSSAQLFAAYQNHLTSRIEAEIAALEHQLRVGMAAFQRVAAFRLTNLEATRDLLSTGTLDKLSELVEIVVRAVPGAGRPLAEVDRAAYARVAEVRPVLQAIGAAKAKIDVAVATGIDSKNTLSSKLTEVRREIATMKSHKAFAAERTALASLSERITAFAPTHHAITTYDFASLLRAMTNKGKEAHKDLVMAQFEQRLDEEYRRLCGATLADMGVRLRPSGDQQDITVTPRVGTTEVARVLSEGELKVHAVAIFMCEASTRPGPVLVFDDPVTSFDYDFVSNFCGRLRDLIRDQPQTQVIVLTHNWDFFVNLQATINRSSGLNTRMSVQVLENCQTVREYKEEVEGLCGEITPILAGPGEPLDDQKAHVSALMRRLVETVVNKYVFAGQRHQYKQKSQPVSEFHLFTKLVPLLPAEADRLRDIYADLSPGEHDDPRNFYTSRTRAQLRTWYDDTLTIKAALETRRS